MVVAHGNERRLNQGAVAVTVSAVASDLGVADVGQQCIAKTLATRRFLDLAAFGQVIVHRLGRAAVINFAVARGIGLPQIAQVADPFAFPTQVAGIVMLRKAENASKIAYFMSAEAVKWRKPVLPGDVLVIDVELTKMRGSIGKAKGVCKVPGRSGQPG